MKFYFEQRFKVYQIISTDVCNNIEMLSNYHSCFLNILFSILFAKVEIVFFNLKSV